jgi:flagellar hook-basal body complex protein FliE
MERTKTTDSFRKSLAKDIEYLRDHIEIAREMLSAMLADNSEDATRRRDKASSSLDLAYKRLRKMQNDYLQEPLERK